MIRKAGKFCCDRNPLAIDYLEESKLQGRLLKMAFVILHFMFSLKIVRCHLMATHQTAKGSLMTRS